MTIFSINFILNKDQTEGGRLEHISLVELLKRARLAFLEKHKMSEDCIIPGIGFLIGELNLRYMAPAFAGDNLKIFLDIKDIFEKRCTLLYKVTKESTNELIATGKTTIIFFDIAANRPAKIPDKFLDVIKGNQEIIPQHNIASRL